MPGLFSRGSFDAFLFDMDGTILTSIEAGERVWSAWALRHGLDPATLLQVIHGVQSVETIRRLNLPGVDPEAEAAAITRAEIADIDGIKPIAGAAEFLAKLPRDRWAVVTSAPRELALRRIEAAGLSMPALLITAEDVRKGKPAPDCFLLAAERLGTSPDRCLVFEDAPAGIAAAAAAGCSIMVVTATHRHVLDTQHDKLADYAELRLHLDATGTLGLARA